MSRWKLISLYSLFDSSDNSSICLSMHQPVKSINSKLPSSCSRENLSVSLEDVDSCIKIHHSFATVVEKLRHKSIFSLKLADQAEYFFKVKWVVWFLFDKKAHEAYECDWYFLLNCHFEKPDPWNCWVKYKRVHGLHYA